MMAVGFLYKRSKGNRQFHCIYNPNCSGFLNKPIKTCWIYKYSLKRLKNFNHGIYFDKFCCLSAL